MNTFNTNSVFTYEGETYKVLRGITFTCGSVNRQDIEYYLDRKYIKRVFEGGLEYMEKGKRIKVGGNVYLANVTLKGYSFDKVNEDLRELLENKLVTLVKPVLYIVYKQKMNSSDKVLVKTTVYYSKDEVKNDLKNMYLNQRPNGTTYSFGAELIEEVGEFEISLNKKVSTVGDCVRARIGGIGGGRIPF